MILSFSTQLNGKPTYFVEKILKGLSDVIDVTDFKVLKSFSNENYNNCSAKLHTLRDDLSNRWHKDIMIDYFINVRQKNMFRFAPRLPVISTQEVFMTYKHSDIIQISIDGRELFGYYERLEFAINDGFDNWEDFFEFFYPKIKASPKEFYKPKLIHWTDLKY